VKLAIITPTYRKLDGSTYTHLRNALESIKNQTHQDYKLFLIGDDYTDNDELMELSKIITSEKIYVENLPVAIERLKFIEGAYSKFDLWRTGGVNAMNTAIIKALEEGYEYICHLDHDDLFLENHLEIISECIEKTGSNFITTKCGCYPNITPVKYYTNYRPVPSRLYKVGCCVNHKYFENILFKNLIEEEGRSYAADADLWIRISKILSNKNEYGIFINETTCRHINGGITLNKPEIIKEKEK